MTRRVAFLVFDGVTLLDVSGPAEALHQAGRLGHPYELPARLPRYGGDVTTASGTVLGGTVAPAGAGPLHTLVVAGGDGLAGPPPGRGAAGGGR
ncbi:hypothetical protein SMICM17S_07455 [Streptomyces microflavus]